MDPEQAYNCWSKQYDTNSNRTRDLEGRALRTVLKNVSFTKCLEIGCGTGKNTEWLITRAQRVLAVDLSENMLEKAKGKIKSPVVEFIQADIKKAWTFAQEDFDLAVFSLVLEHIENLEHVFSETASLMNQGGHIYIGELHPFKQYLGSKAKFEAEDGTHVVECYNHHISAFIRASGQYGFSVEVLDEWFDDDDRHSVPRILTLLLRKN